MFTINIHAHFAEHEQVASLLDSLDQLGPLSRAVMLDDNPHDHDQPPLRMGKGPDTIDESNPVEQLQDVTDMLMELCISARGIAEANPTRGWWETTKLLESAAAHVRGAAQLLYREKVAGWREHTVTPADFDGRDCTADPCIDPLCATHGVQADPTPPMGTPRPTGTVEPEVYEWDRMYLDELVRWTREHITEGPLVSVTDGTMYEAYRYFGEHGTQTGESLQFIAAMTPEQESCLRGAFMDADAAFDQVERS